jgi:hypothetical protein
MVLTVFAAVTTFACYPLMGQNPDGMMSGPAEWPIQATITLTTPKPIHLDDIDHVELMSLLMRACRELK